MIPLRDDIPTKHPPVLTVGFIAACVLVFLWQISLGEPGQTEAVYSFGFIPAVLLAGRQLPPELALVPPEMTILTSMFLHGGWMHLIGNMLYLWIFGNNVEDAMGHLRFIVFYVVCGTAAAFAQALDGPASTIPMIGASGAISGVLGAYLLLYPKAHVVVLLPIGFFLQILRLPAMVVLGFWFVLQFVNASLSSSQEGGVAFWAHVGGFVAGMLLIPLFRYKDVPLFGGHGRPRG